MRFDAETDLRYEQEHGEARAAYLRKTIYAGLLIYNAYILSNLVLVPDMIWDSIAIRVFLITPFSLGLAFLVGRVSAPVREWLVALGMLNAHALPTYLFWSTTTPLGTHTFGDLNLMLVYGTMLLALRFRQAVFFVGGAFVLTYAAILTKPDLETMLDIAFMIQFAAACVFVLYGNWLIERRRCVDYVTALTATRRAEQAESSSQELQEISKTDALTGLPNRRYLDEKLEEWFAGHHAMAIMMIDIDHFKLFNDTLGHPAGDDCLRQIGRVFANLANRPEVFCARFGGEEFTVAVRGSGELDAARLAFDIVKSIEALGIEHPGRNDGIGVVTASVGVAMKPWGFSATKSMLLSQADGALYRAKRRGRNCFEMSNGLESLNTIGA